VSNTSQFHPLQSCLARIFFGNDSRKSGPCGAGVLLSGERVLTCAHVIASALNVGRGTEEQPAGVVSLDFPLTKSKRKVNANLIFWDVDSDLAGLKLLEPLPSDVEAISLIETIDLLNDTVKAFGFPEGYPKGTWANGILRGPNTDGWLEIVDTQSTGYFIQPGFSGGPVWDETLKCCIGIVIAAEKNPSIRTGYLIPTSVIVEKWPDIQSIPKKLKVNPTGEEVEIHSWSGSPLPDVYSYVGEMGSPANSNFYRVRDAHQAVLLSDASTSGETFLIDKYAITCQQFCIFLNELSEQRIIQTILKDGEYLAVASGHTLAVDALEHWKRPVLSQPWLHTPKPFGITYQSSRWNPIPESELLPVTLITWWGARLYSLWVHESLSSPASDSFSYLPTSAQWLAAATWDPVTHVRRRFPWGDTWNYQLVNFSGYWAGRNITEAEWQNQWANNPLTHMSTRPLPVAELTHNISPIGCVQLLGNTWEWASAELGSRMPIHGGCALSPMEYCLPDEKSLWPIDKPYEYIGFRCCFPLRRIA